MKRLLFGSLSVLFVMACAHTKMPAAMATLSPISGSNASGTVHFRQMSDGNVEVQLDLTGVPAGEHGFHLHETGDCGNNGNNAGGHFNPTAMPHAAPDASSHHAGDWGNVTAGDNGEIHTTLTSHSISVSPGMSSVIGHAVVLHGGRDDLTTQPSGNSGPRIACGVVSLMDSSMPMH